MFGKVTVLEFALLAQNVYFRGTKKLSKFSWYESTMKSKVNKPSFDNAFFARLYVRVPHPTMKPTAAVIAYRGTEALTHIDNDISDLKIGLEIIPEHEKLAKAFYVEANHYIMANYGLHLRITGHSLGGAYAQLTAIESDLHPETVVFNSPGVGDLKGVNSQANYPYIHNFNSEDGIINKVGKTLGSVSELKVTQGKYLLKAGRLFDHTILGDVLEGYGDYKQHQIGDVLQAIESNKQVASESF